MSRFLSGISERKCGDRLGFRLLNFIIDISTRYLAIQTYGFLVVPEMLSSSMKTLNLSKRCESRVVGLDIFK